MKTLAFSLLLFSAAAIVPAADNSFSGTWKMNLEKSHFTGSTFTISKLPSSMLHYSNGTTEFDFQIDGKDYPMRPGITEAWTQSGENAWDVIDKRDGKVLSREHYVLSNSGQTWTWEETVSRPGGQTDHSTGENERVSGGPGPLGTWKRTKINIKSAATLVLQIQGTDRFSMRNAEMKYSVEGRCDGSPMVVNNQASDSGEIETCKIVDAQTLERTLSRQGKIMLIHRFILSADGRTLRNVTWTPGHESEKTTTVWDRQ
jgi:hypothetical protein